MLDMHKASQQEQEYQMLLVELSEITRITVLCALLRLTSYARSLSRFRVEDGT
jgi:hypothetical protein